jgi:hypothetical protein
MSKKLTEAQRATLQLAVSSRHGNPWPLISVKRRTGGSFGRMFSRLQSLGYFDQSNRITDAGRAAIASPAPKGET